MSAVKKLNLISVEDYLAGELVSPVKHEYLGGVVYAMAGARNAHNLVATNVVGSLHARLRGRRCRPYNSDTKIRLRLPLHVRFDGLETVIPLGEIETELPLTEIYDGIQFTPEPEDEP